jgi:hypothetical protein
MASKVPEASYKILSEEQARRQTADVRKMIDVVFIFDIVIVRFKFLL